MQRERYRRIEAYAIAHGLPTSYIVETLIDRFLDAPFEIPPRPLRAAAKATRALRGLPDGSELSLQERAEKLNAFWAKQEEIKAENGDRRSRLLVPGGTRRIPTCECGNEKQKGHRACDRCERLDGVR